MVRDRAKDRAQAVSEIAAVGWHKKTDFTPAAVAVFGKAPTGLQIFCGLLHQGL